MIIFNKQNEIIVFNTIGLRFLIAQEGLYDNMYGFKPVLCNVKLINK